MQDVGALANVIAFAFLRAKFTYSLTQAMSIYLLTGKPFVHFENVQKS
jgi:hypothetical protein